MAHALPVALALAAIAGMFPARGDSIRCDGGIVSVGDSKLDLLGKCGAPGLIGQPVEMIRLAPASKGGAERRYATTVERWTYDFGPSRLVHVVTLELGRLVAVERESYGTAAAVPGRERAAFIPRARCDELVPREAITEYELLARCGEPALREVGVVTTSAVAGDRQSRSAIVSRTTTVEFWYYDFGPQTLVRRAAVERGRVVRVDTGGYGYSSPEER